MSDTKEEKNCPVKTRQSNFELLRILSMFLIIAHHFAVHGGYADILPVNAFVIRFFEIGGKIGVNIFILISGHFLIDAKFKWKKLIKLVIQILFYSVFIYLILLSCGKIEFTFTEFAHALFPISSNSYWFVTAYVITYCLFPCLNAIIKNCSKGYVIFLIAFLILLQCALAYIFSINYLSSVAWFATLYLIAAFLKLYPLRLLKSFKFTLTLTAVSFTAIAAFNTFAKIYLCDMTNLVCLICSVALFCTADNLRVKQNKIINKVAKTTFGIYLIHDNPFMRRILWVDILNCPLHATWEIFIIFAFSSVIIVFTVCMLIDFIRELIFCAALKIYSKIKARKQKE